MTCFMCKGTTQEKLSNFTVDIDGCIVVVKGVPAHVCSQCGESSYSDETARQLEQIVRRVKDSAATEVAVVSYTKKVA
jgi:YgiT-type zinc finger domain-containing protein